MKKYVAGKLPKSCIKPQTWRSDSNVTERVSGLLIMPASRQCGSLLGIRLRENGGMWGLLDASVMANGQIHPLFRQGWRRSTNVY
jgi:hypothetical protein